MDEIVMYIRDGIDRWLHVYVYMVKIQLDEHFYIGLTKTCWIVAVD